MAGTLALTKAELTRLLHNRRYFIFTVAFPVILYLLIGRQVTAKAYQINFGASSGSPRCRPTATWSPRSSPRWPPRSRPS
jgi:hypothetical protein